MATAVKTNLNGFLVCCIVAVLIATHTVTLAAEVRGRGRRSDHGGPLETVVNALSQKVEQLTAYNAAQDTRLQQLSAENKALSASISALSTRLGAVETPVAFTAVFSQSDITGLGKGQTLKFDRIVFNAGNGYSPATGFFTAPSSGTYLFYFSLMRHYEDDTVAVGLYKGTHMLARAYACCSRYESGSSAATTHLKQGRPCICRSPREARWTDIITRLSAVSSCLPSNSYRDQWL